MNESMILSVDPRTVPYPSIFVILFSVTDPTQPGPTKKVTGTLDPNSIDPTKFEEYNKKCVPTVFASCRKLHACLKNPTCRPSDEDVLKAAEDKITAWERKRRAVGRHVYREKWNNEKDECVFLF